MFLELKETLKETQQEVLIENLRHFRETQQEVLIET